MRLSRTGWHLSKVWGLAPGLRFQLNNIGIYALETRSILLAVIIGAGIVENSHWDKNTLLVAGEIKKMVERKILSILDRVCWNRLMMEHYIMRWSGISVRDLSVKRKVFLSAYTQGQLKHHLKHYLHSLNGDYPYRGGQLTPCYTAMDSPPPSDGKEALGSLGRPKRPWRPKSKSSLWAPPRSQSRSVHAVVKDQQTKMSGVDYDVVKLYGLLYLCSYGAVTTWIPVSTWLSGCWLIFQQKIDRVEWSHHTLSRLECRYRYE